MSIPSRLVTDRLLLRPWHAHDAGALLPVLDANQGHIAQWIPRHVSTPAPVAELAARLAAFAEAFVEDREWRYAIIARDQPDREDASGAVLGEVDLFPRDANGRVHLPVADRAEIGYWLRHDMTGRGLVTEAVRALIDVARTVRAFRQVEIRCDARNVASAAVPRRLGFALEDSKAARQGDSYVELQLWTLALASDGDT